MAVLSACISRSGYREPGLPAPAEFEAAQIEVESSALVRQIGFTFTRRAHLYASSWGGFAARSRWVGIVTEGRYDAHRTIRISLEGASR